MEAVRTSETSVDNHFTRKYNPEDSSEHHTRRRENLKSHKFKNKSQLQLITQQNQFYSLLSTYHEAYIFSVCDESALSILHIAITCVLVHVHPTSFRWRVDREVWSKQCIWYSQMRCSMTVQHRNTSTTESICICHDTYESSTLLNCNNNHHEKLYSILF
jgi:hypothetical protein